ncbi:MAG: HesA/MoeB/ThiF family protein [Candidatus Helarchaeota archaeon]
MLSPEEKDRYHRQILVPEIGENGQKTLKKSSVLIVGTGGLGSAASLYLAAAGIGKIGILDMDVVEVSNLQRQVIHATSRVGVKKIESAEKVLKDLNPNIEIITFSEKFEEKNASKLVRQFQYVIDASDNFPTKFLINDKCAENNIPCTIGGVRAFEGQFITVIPHQTTCYRCVFHEPPPPMKGKLPILGSTAGIGGLIEATECVKYFVGLRDDLLTNCLLFFDLRAMSFDKITILRDPKCKTCGTEA